MLTRRRVATFGQAWLPMPLTRNRAAGSKPPPIVCVEDLRVLVDQMHNYAAVIGRTDPIEVVMILQIFPHAASNSHLIEHIKELAATWVTQVLFNGAGRDLSEAEDHLRAFDAEVISVMAGN